MALDPRLASPQLLELAAVRLTQRQDTAPTPTVVLLAYDAYDEEPPRAGARDVLYLPQQAPSVEAWTQATARFREPPRTRQGDDTTQKG